MYLLQDKNGTDIVIGSKVTNTKKLGRYRADNSFVCVFCKPQHRYGFVSIDKPNTYNDEFISDEPDLPFYLTPRNARSLIVIDEE